MIRRLMNNHLSWPPLLPPSLFPPSSWQSPHYCYCLCSLFLLLSLVNLLPFAIFIDVHYATPFHSAAHALRCCLPVGEVGGVAGPVSIIKWLSFLIESRVWVAGKVNILFPPRCCFNCFACPLPLLPSFSLSFPLPFYVSLLPFLDLLLPPFPTLPAAARHFAFCFNCRHKAEAQCGGEKGNGKGGVHWGVPPQLLLFYLLFLLLLLLINWQQILFCVGINKAWAAASISRVIKLYPPFSSLFSIQTAL